MYRYLRKRWGSLREARAQSTPSRPPSATAPAPRKLAWLLICPGKQATTEEIAVAAQIREAVPRVQLAAELVEEFFRLVRARDAGAVDAWLTAAEGTGLPALRSFVGGVRRDLEAVLNGIRLPWSNGPVEGQVNRLKTLKRQMYGRAGFSLLRSRVLPSPVG